MAAPVPIAIIPFSKAKTPKTKRMLVLILCMAVGLTLILSGGPCLGACPVGFHNGMLLPCG